MYSYNDNINQPGNGRDESAETYWMSSGNKTNSYVGFNPKK